MEAISLSAIAANFVGVVVAGAAMIGYLKRAVRAEAQSVVISTAVSKEDFAAIFKGLAERVDDHEERLRIEESHRVEFGTMKAQIGSVKESVEEVKKAVERGQERHSQELTGAMNTMRQTMVDFVKASTGK